MLHAWFLCENDPLPLILVLGAKDQEAVAMDEGLSLLKGKISLDNKKQLKTAQKWNCGIAWW